MAARNPAARIRQTEIRSQPKRRDARVGGTKVRYSETARTIEETILMKLKIIRSQVIIITSATSGIGLVTARAAAQLGATVILAARTEESLRKLAHEITSNGGRADYVVADVSIPEQVRRIAEVAVERFGGFDTWVNNAGISIYGSL